MTSLRFVEQLRDLVGGVEVVLSDIWGVVHNGLESFPEACEALHTFRRQGGTVILITNAPRPADSVQRQLRKLGVADEAGHKAELGKVLAVGDSVRTDIAGAHGCGIDCLFVTRGIHAEEFAGIDQLDPASVKELFGHPPKALMRELRW